MSKVSAIQIKQWKEVHGSVNKGILKEISNDKEGNPITIEHEFYFRDISINDLSIMGLKTDPIEKVISLYDQCILSASETITKNDQMRYSAAKYIDNTFKTYECDIVKL